MRNFQSFYSGFVLMVCLMTPLAMLAQPGNPSAPVPFGFIELLAGGAIAFGAYQKKKLMDKNNK